MSDRERHERFSRKGWLYMGSAEINGRVTHEFWQKPDGSPYVWAVGQAPPNETDGDEDEFAYIGRTDGHLSGEEWKDAARRKVRDVRMDDYKLLEGTRLPEDEDDVKALVKPYLTWDAPFFVAVASGGIIKYGCLVSTDKAMSTLDCFSGGRLIVVGPVWESWAVTDYLDQRHKKENCGYWWIRLSPYGQKWYNTSDFLSDASHDPRPVLPMRYNRKPRAAVRREALSGGFDGCYERVRLVLDAERHPERLHVIAELPEFVVFGEPGYADKLEREYGTI